MRLYPALRIADAVIQGQETDSHNTLAYSHRLGNPPESSRGFTPDGKLFLTRRQALGWLKKHDIKAFRKLPGKAHYDGLHSEHLAKVYGVEQKPEAMKIREEAMGQAATTGVEKPKVVDLSEKSVLMYDRGLYLYIAEKLAETFKKVHYYIPNSSPYPASNLHNIATGIDGVERCFDFWGTLDKVDLVVFADTYDGSLQQFLRDKGYTVFGSGKAEIIETDKIFFMEQLEKLGLPVPRTYLAEGLDDLLAYLEKEGGPKWLKGMTRGDFETKKFVDMDHFRPFLDDLKRRLGSRVDTIEILVQDPVDSECEAGYDGWVVDGQFTSNTLCGYEVKDKAFVASVVEQPAPLVKGINDAFASLFKKLGYRGAYSTEIRITKDGTPYYIDPTCRVGSPPGELMSELYKNYAQIIWDVAHGVLPTPEPVKKYGAQMVMTSDWYREEHEMYVEFPDKFKDNVKLSNFYRKGGKTFIVPNETEQYFGSVVAVGDTLEEAIEKCEEVLKSIVCEKFDFDDEAFEDAQEVVECGKKFGLEF